VRSAMIMMNGGLGNGVILAPALAAFERHFPGSRYFTAPNAVLESGWVRTALGMRGADGHFPPLWRRFAPADREAFWSFVDTEGIDLVVNLRKEAAEYDGDYFGFRAQAAGRGVECWDLHELDEWRQRLPIGEQAARVLRAHGVPVDLTDPAWLASHRTPRAGVVGCYVGASVGVKRWPAHDWAELITHLHDRELTVEVAAGPDADEREMADLLSTSPAVTGTAFPASLESMRDWIAGLDVLISNDTVTAHVAAALGTPVVTLYLATDGAVWSPVAAPRASRAVQSRIALSCTLMKPDGTCQRFYTGCPAPCASGVRPPDVLAELDRLEPGVGRCESQEVTA
jgi:ADP-heptose:LPS heptosyltransferase